jgi:hypothetical protein
VANAVEIEIQIDGKTSILTPTLFRTVSSLVDTGPYRTRSSHRTVTISAPQMQPEIANAQRSVSASSKLLLFELL